MSDNTTLNSGAGGDVIRTDEYIDPTTHASTKTQVVKLATGGTNVAAQLVVADYRALAMPVNDKSNGRILERISAQLDELIELLSNG
jgi:hypothetical protein